jgi:hypothetical protein
MIVRFIGYRLSQDEGAGTPVFECERGSIFIPSIGADWSDDLDRIRERLTERIPECVIREFWLKGGEYDGTLEQS